MFKLAAFADEASGNLSGQIAAMKRNGVDFLEIRGVDGQNISDISKEKAQEIHDRLKDNGLAVWSLGSPYGKIGITEDFEAHLDKYKRSIEIAHILEAQHMRIFSFYVRPEDSERYHDEVMRRLEKFVDAVHGSGIILCHENEKGIYGDIADRCLEIHKCIPELKAVFDPANFIQCGQDTIKAWEMLAPYVEYMHIKDALADGSVVPAGEGIGNLPKLLKEYQGQILTLEPHLSVFEGFDKLEKENESIKKYVYSSSDEAFDVAVSSLKNIIKALS
ncbi:MAG: sugar phosphate isomerase/epimerase [Lachnospiraceae bacterium]|nr:sugar phosphate isomerase/epimerase [Lachnospiraceae bacterium]